MTVQELRDNGYKIRVTHYRYYTNSKLLLKSEAVRQGFNEPKPHGGKVVVEVRTPDGNELTGCSVCSRSDPYNRKFGVKIALGRALRGSR
jgi:hypothetical protein